MGPVQARLRHVEPAGAAGRQSGRRQSHPRTTKSGAISNLTASYASASEYYMMNIYGKEATAYYDLFNGLRHLKRGETKATPVATEPNDAIREELDEFVCVRNGGKPETDGFWASRNLAVIKAGVRSARRRPRHRRRRRSGGRGVKTVMAGLVPAIPAKDGGALLSGMRGSSPRMTEIDGGDCG